MGCESRMIWSIRLPSSLFAVAVARVSLTRDTDGLGCRSVIVPTPGTAVIH